MKNSKEIAQESIRVMSDKMFLLLAVLVTLAGTFLRFIWLGLKPFHHDEGVNGVFLSTLAKTGEWNYDPSNYHGPDLYYISLFVTNIIGLDDVGTRSSVAIFGVFIIILAFWLRRSVGDIGAIVAAILLAISPGMVYISRYFIHEIIFVFFSFAIPVSILFFIERRKAGVIAQGLFAIVLGVALLPAQVILVNNILGTAGMAALTVRILGSIGVAFLIFLLVKRAAAWMDGSPIYLMLGAVSVCMLFATKETGFITVGTMLLSCVSVVLWEKISGRKRGSEESLSYKRFVEALGDGRNRQIMIASSVGLFVILWIVFFSSFFTNAKGIVDSFKAYAFWTQTGTVVHQNGFWAYLKWMWEIEAPILLLSALGVIFALAKQRNRFVVFAAFWAMGISLAYTLIPYKTPWLMISFILPMTVVAGHAIDEMITNRIESLKLVGAILIMIAVGIAGKQSWSLNFDRYDDQSLPYVYAHSWRTLDDLTAKLDELDKRVGGQGNLTIQVVASEFWPLPWSLRNFRSVGFPGEPKPFDGKDVILARYKEREEEVVAYYQDKYRYLGKYPLRPTLEIMLLVRKDIAGSEGEPLRLELMSR